MKRVWDVLEAFIEALLIVILFVMLVFIAICIGAAAGNTH